MDTWMDGESIMKQEAERFIKEANWLSWTFHEGNIRLERDCFTSLRVVLGFRRLGIETRRKRWIDLDRAAKLKGCEFDVIFQGVNRGRLENLVTQVSHKIFLFIEENNFRTFRAVHNEDKIYEASRVWNRTNWLGKILVSTHETIWNNKSPEVIYCVLFVSERREKWKKEAP